MVVNLVLGEQTASFPVKSQTSVTYTLIYVISRDSSGWISLRIAYIALVFKSTLLTSGAPLRFSFYLLNPQFLPSAMALIYVSCSVLTLWVGVISPNFLKPEVPMPTHEHFFPGSV